MQGERLTFWWQLVVFEIDKKLLTTKWKTTSVLTLDKKKMTYVGLCFTEI